MVVDYYNILMVSRTPSEDELRRAYKKLAMKWHPDKHPNGLKQLAEEKFKLICEAYNVLSDPTKRRTYDLRDEDGESSSPSSVASDDDFFDDFLGDFGNHGNNFEGYVRNKYGMHDSYTKSSPTKKAGAIENNLGCTLEELYKGSKRKMVISRIVPDKFGKATTLEEVLAIDIKPGWKKGTKITFPEKGHQENGLIAGDLIFVIDEKPHLTFTRDGNDLLITQKISLVEALTGKTLNLTTLDGRNLSIDVSDIVKPGHEVVISGEGMPLSKDPRKKGNLRIMFDVMFPPRLSADQKAVIKRALT